MVSSVLATNLCESVSFPADVLAPTNPSQTGQAAYISVYPNAYASPVFSTCPKGAVIPTLILAVLAAIVASQAIITATFQLIAQIIKLSYFPPLKVIHTSKIYHHQLYVPMANYLLCIGTVAVAAVFNNTNSLGNAYGVCVIFVTFFDTLMTALTALIVWRVKPYYVFLPWLAFASMDGAFLSSALLKVPTGAWFTLTLAAVLALIFLLWRFGKESQWRAEAEDRHNISKFVNRDDNGDLRLAGYKGGESLSVIKGLGIYFDKSGLKTPQVFSQYVSKFVCIPEVMVFFHMRPLEYPTVSPDERFIVSRIKSLPNCYRVVLRYGFMDEVITPDLAVLIYRNLREYVLRDMAPRVAEKGIPAPEMAKLGPKYADGQTLAPVLETTLSDQDASRANSIEEALHNEEQLDLVSLEHAYEHRVLYILGKEELVVKRGTRWWKQVLLRTFLLFRDYSRSKMSNIKLPTDRLVELGFIKEMGDTDRKKE